MYSSSMYRCHACPALRPCGAINERSVHGEDPPLPRPSPRSRSSRLCTSAHAGIVLGDALANAPQTAIRTVNAGDYWIGGKRGWSIWSPPSMTDATGCSAAAETTASPSRALRSGCRIVEGCENADIAKQFSLSEETARHLSNIFDKTGVSTRLELAPARDRPPSHRRQQLDFPFVFRHSSM